MLLTTSSLRPKIERQRSVNDLRPSILGNHEAMHRQWSIIVLPAASLGKHASDKIVTMSQNVRQWSVNNCCTGILDNITRIERRYTTMNLSAAFIGKNASVDVASASYNCVPTARQGSELYTVINCSMPFVNGGLRSQSLPSVLVLNIRNMHAMSDWSDYLPCSCRVNI